jgi:transposase
MMIIPRRQHTSGLALGAALRTGLRFHLPNHRASTLVVLDETGWHVGGLGAWLHAVVSPEATAYVIDPSRSGDVAERLLGLDYGGVMIHDGWSTLRQFPRGPTSAMPGAPTAALP